MLYQLLVQNKLFSGQEASNLKGYYRTVATLNTKEAGVTSEIPKGVENTPLTLLFSPWFMYGSVILFFALFLGAILVQIINKSLDRRRTMASLAVALVVATLPVTLKTMLQVTSLETRAGPDEVPRNITIKETSPTTVIITWDTQAEKIGSVRFGPAPISNESDRMVIGDMGRKTRSHTAELKDIASGVEYEFEILSGKEWYNDGGNPLKFKLGF